jgi:hypothetical protein
LFRPPTPERVTEFFEFLRVRIATGIQASVVEPGGGGDRLEEDRLLGWSRQTVRSRQHDTAGSAWFVSGVRCELGVHEAAAPGGEIYERASS